MSNLFWCEGLLLKILDALQLKNIFPQSRALCYDVGDLFLEKVKKFMVTGDEFTESAKAVQEVAKTSNTALGIVKDFGGFVSRIIGEPIDEAVGMLTDKLRYSRWERRQRLIERSKQFIEERDIKGELKPVTPKIALPIIENASLEDNDELQDLWARLIASSVDPNFDGTLRTAFIDILKQLEVIDVHILNYIYNKYLKEIESNTKQIKHSKNPNLKIYNLNGNRVPIWGKIVIKNLGISGISYMESIDNLIRVRCVASFINDKEIEVPLDDRRSLKPQYLTLAKFNSSRSEKVKFNSSR